jgi:hypothetical protein
LGTVCVPNRSLDVAAPVSGVTPRARLIPLPSVFLLNYVQAHHLDLDFYDRFFKPGAYLDTHREHMGRWHGAS